MELTWQFGGEVYQTGEEMRASENEFLVDISQGRQGLDVTSQLALLIHYGRNNAVVFHIMQDMYSKPFH